MVRCTLSLVLVFAAAACAHRPETTVHLSAPSGAWVARDVAGARLCSLPCRVELDTNESVVVARENGGQAFVVEQASLGAGTWNGSVLVRRDPTEGARAVKAFSNALLTAGGSMVEARDDHRRTTGIVLTGLGAIGVLASDTWKGPPREELRLERLSAPKD